MIQERIIHINNEKIDWTSWIGEKSRNTIMSLIRANEIIKSMNLSKLEEKEDLQGEIYNAIADTLKIFSFAYDTPCNHVESDLIYSKGYDGFDEFLVKCGIKKETDKQKIFNNKINLLKDLKLYVSGDKTNRTFIHEKLMLYKGDEKPISQLKEYLENLSMGLCTWLEFQQFAVPKIIEFEEIINKL